MSDSSQSASSADEESDDEFRGSGIGVGQRTSKGRGGRGDKRGDSKRRTVAFVSSSSSSFNTTTTKAGGEGGDDESQVEQKFAGLIHEQAVSSKTNEDFREALRNSDTGATSVPAAAPMKPPAAPIPSDIGAWQKHTKGIGLKLLQKFGFTGRLGAKEDGRIRPVDVVSRPIGEGLGFTDLSSKKEKHAAAIETAVPDVSASSKSEKRSRAPAAEDIADTKSWKKGRMEKAVKILNVTDFLGEQSQPTNNAQQVILDMRGEKVRVLNVDEVQRRGIASVEGSLDAAAGQQPKLGQEMLYNVNLMVDLFEADVSTFSKKSSAEVSRMASCKADMMILEKELARDIPKLERISKLIDALARIEAKQKSDPGAISLEAVVQAITTLYSAFTEEFRLFGVLHLLPTLAEPILHSVCNHWDPMIDPSRIADVGLELTPLVKFFAERGESALANQAQQMIEILIEATFLPNVRRSITNAWDVQYPDNCIFLLQTLQTILPSATMGPVLEMMIQPKLLNGIKEWSGEAAGAVPLHLWLLPWLPVLGDYLGHLFPDVRRKLGHEIKSWHVADTSNKALAMLSPWLPIFDSTSVHHLLIRSVVPKLVDGLREMSVEVNVRDNTILKCVLSWHGVVPLFHLKCVLEGEFFPKWLHALSKMLRQETDFDDISEWYLFWKSAMPEVLLATEERIRQPFNMALEMINLALEGGEREGSSSHLPLYSAVSEKVSYLSILEQRKRDATANSENSHSVNQSAAKISSLKDLVEIFAEKNQLVFMPRPERHPDGHTLYSFGACIIYLLHDVVYLREAIGSFKPASLPNLLERAAVAI